MIKEGYINKNSDISFQTRLQTEKQRVTFASEKSSKEWEAENQQHQSWNRQYQIWHQQYQNWNQEHQNQNQQHQNRIHCQAQREELKKRLEEFSVSHPDVQSIKIMLAGQTGAGKSSFINSVKNAFRGRITSEALVDQSSGKSFTKSLKSHKVKGAGGDLPFVLTDVMGLEPDVLEGSQPEDIINAIYGHVKDEYKFKEGKPLSHKSEDYVSDPSLSDQTFCLVYIVDANTIQYAMIDDLKKLYTSKKIKEKMHLCSKIIGVPMNCIFPVKNYHDEIDVDDDVDVLILKAFDQIVNVANDRLREAASN
ncbi:hypothetical protein G5714_010674 [Onychostoma macrolepis]|uniref:G domain-containing protein n=1 Tax=Onychostoma macrolepis TaxID=369639 RepID=A0A7J6CMW6_9TELE|nr:hypothetical protein G5714_010674 [Onychostoma macrolepis]